MDIDDLCHTSLVLGLGLSSTGEPKPNKSAAAHDGVKTSLALSLSAGEASDHILHPVKRVDSDFNNHQSAYVYGHESSASSLSNVSLKREREMGSEEAEVQRVWSRVCNEDDDGSNARKKLRLTKVQSALLEESFKRHSTLNPKQKQELARELELRPRQVEVWFQNRRARTKLKQTEVDCELLKKCCETLTDENRRLQKELQELKHAAVVSYTTMCPSCERIGGGGGPESSTKSHFARPHFYSRSTNTSAAC